MWAVCADVVRRNWPDDLPTDRNLAVVCPLLGQRKQVREVIKIKLQVRVKDLNPEGTIFRGGGAINASSQVEILAWTLVHSPSASVL